MSKRSIQIQETLYCGIGVSAKSLTVATQRVGQPVEQTSLRRRPQPGDSDAGTLASFRLATFNSRLRSYPQQRLYLARGS